MYFWMLGNMKFSLLQMLLQKFSATYLLLCSVLSLIIIFQYRRRHFYKFSRYVSGPPQWPLIGAAKLWYTGPEAMVAQVHEYFREFSARGEEIANTWFGHKFIIFPLSAWNHNFFLTKILEKSDLYHVTTRLFRDGVLGVSTIKKWRSDRKMIAPSFQHSVIKSYIAIFFEESNLLMQKFAPFEKSGEPFYPGGLLNLATFDMVIRSTLGENPRAQDRTDHPAVKAMMDILHSIQWRIFHPFLMLDFFTNILGYKKQELGYEKVFRDFTRDIVRRMAVKESMERSTSFAAHMMKNEMSEEDLITHIVNVVFAGTDTTKTANFSILLMLALHPKVQDKAYEEVISIMGSDKSREPSYEDLMSMNYIERVIKEALRMYPPVPMVGRMISTDNDKIQGLPLPRGASVVLDIYALHREASNFPNPHQFDPDRFLPGEAAKRPIGSYIPFLIGSRDCIGRKYAMLQMKTVVSTTLRNYRILPSPTCPTMDDVVLRMQTTSNFAANCQIRLEARD